MRDQISQKASTFIDDAYFITASSALQHPIEKQDYNHWCRTACYAEMIRCQLPYGNADLSMKEVVVAALCHDLGRHDHSDADPMHGIRGAAPTATALHSLGVAKLLHWNYEMFGKIVHAVIHHCDPGEGKSFLDGILKDADRLDMCRFNDDRPDDDRLQYMPTIAMLEQAKVWSLEPWPKS